MSTGISLINEKVKEHNACIATLRAEMEKVIVGQKYLIDRLMVGLLANGHILLEGVPGLAKTLSVKTLAAALSTTFRRIQFTPKSQGNDATIINRLGKIRYYFLNIHFK